MAETSKTSALPASPPNINEFKKVLNTKDALPNWNYGVQEKNALFMKDGLDENKKKVTDQTMQTLMDQHYERTKEGSILTYQHGNMAEDFKGVSWKPIPNKPMKEMHIKGKNRLVRRLQ